MISIPSRLASMTPQRVAEMYLASRMVSHLHSQQILRVAGRIPSMDSAVINLYLKARLADVSSVTVANERRIIMSLWRFAYDERLVESPPRQVVRIKAPLPPVVAWTVRDLSKLVKTACSLRDKTLQNGLSSGLFLECWVRLGYDTGARYGDIFAFSDSNLLRNVLTWSMRKTGGACSRTLSDETLETVRSWRTHRRLQEGYVDGSAWLDGVCCRRYSFTLMRRLLMQADLAGSGRWIRRSAATHVEQQQAGAARFFLGHRSLGMAEKHYLDRSQLDDDLPRPPRLTE